MESCKQLLQVFRVYFPLRPTSVLLAMMSLVSSRCPPSQLRWSQILLEMENYSIFGCFVWRKKFSLWLQQRKYLISFLSLVKAFLSSSFFQSSAQSNFHFSLWRFSWVFYFTPKRTHSLSAVFSTFFSFFSSDDPQNSLLLPTSRKLEWSNFLLSLTQKGRNTFRTNLQQKNN